MKQLSTTFWGTRGSISTPGQSTQKYGGNTTCISVQYGDDSIVLDAGTGIRLLGRELAKKLEINDPAHQHILLSHTHWDHIQGLPFFEPAYLPGCKLSIYGSPQKGRFLASILQGQMDNNYFPIKMSELAAKIAIHEVSDQTIKIGEISIKIQEQICHPGGSLRFCIEAGNKKIIFSTDVELDAIFRADKPSADTDAMAAEYRDFISGADLMIADGQYTEKEYESKKGWGHTSIPLLLQIAHEQKVKQLVVTHHDPDHSDQFIDELWHKYAPQYRNTTPSMKLLWAREGSTIVV